ncbi:MAG: hypothetical protein GXY76_18400 [Chloroflexi bacterium]|nr:hypothetical protein [Chloroflexota bacterium]
MSKEAVQAIMGTAIIDKEFSRDLLNARRERAIARFELTPEERRAVSGIKAETLEQFARQLDSWLLSKEQEVAFVHPAFFRLKPAPALSS